MNRSVRNNLRVPLMRKPIEGKNIVVIGAGVGGLSAGILLLLLGYHVTIVEKIGSRAV
ncbi:MAG: hypothetical protein MZV70_31210 [Desulfobacterales bacterium]|nr:hypothetical protein [Desulfobacterales bacterium]